MILYLVTSFLYLIYTLKSKPTQKEVVTQELYNKKVGSFTLSVIIIFNIYNVQILTREFNLSIYQQYM